jgi:flagellar biosynthesis component FlhA
LSQFCSLCSFVVDFACVLLTASIAYSKSLAKRKRKIKKNSSDLKAKKGKEKEEKEKEIEKELAKDQISLEVGLLEEIK